MTGLDSQKNIELLCMIGQKRISINFSNQLWLSSLRLERDIIVIPKEYDEFDQDVTMTIYGDKVVYIDYSSESSIIIDNAMIADSQKKLFKLLYKKNENFNEVSYFLNLKLSLIELQLQAIQQEV